MYLYMKMLQTSQRKYIFITLSVNIFRSSIARRLPSTVHEDANRRKRHIERRNWGRNLQEDRKSDRDEVLHSVMLQRDVM